MIDNNAFLAIFPADLITKQQKPLIKFVKFHVCHSVRFLFLMWTTLNIKIPLILREVRKWKGLAGDNCKSTLNREFEQDWSVDLGATVGADIKFKNIFLEKKKKFLVRAQEWDCFFLRWREAGNPCQLNRWKEVHTQEWVLSLPHYTYII